MVIVHPERPEHAQGVRKVEELAFQRPAEAELVDRIRARGGVTLSLVALENGEVVGHVLFTPVTIVEENGAQHQAVGLGPVAVLPSHQRQGIGARLIRAGLEEIRQKGYPVVVVLGDPRYYTRFGFGPARHYGVRFQDENVPAEAFQLIELRRGVMEGHSGVAVYGPEFQEV